MTDVTARRADEERLRESERDFRFMAENATDLISRLSTDATCLYASPASERLFGYPAIPLARMIEWVADWVGHGHRSLGKETHYDSRDGSF